MSWLYRAVVLSFGVAAVVLFGGCGFIAGAISKAASLAPQVATPGLNQMGVSLEGYNVSIDNLAPYYARVIINGEVPAILKPGDAAVSNQCCELLAAWGVQVPVAVTFYCDPELKDYVGVATRSFTYFFGGGTVFAWSVQPGDIQLAKGQKMPPCQKSPVR